ncbi:uncharacterized protein JCM10292_005766 [Rhodotorula paludigena]|uniref:uncharacterized protein n=1 Tax=Rhodotorula paludigena TaxID=86838 RepID=UPI00316D12C8
MHASTALLVLASFAGAVVATGGGGGPSYPVVKNVEGYGRFPCTVRKPDGSWTGDQRLCAESELVSPGLNKYDNYYQGDGRKPEDSQCVKQHETGGWFCGIAGAQCSKDKHCDNGKCVNGRCQGGFTQRCGSSDSNCSGYLYCTDYWDRCTPNDTCGGKGAFCKDPRAVTWDCAEHEARATYDQFCASGYCHYGNAVCSDRYKEGETCTSDRQGCADGLRCSDSTGKCVQETLPSPRARTRRSVDQHKRALCPAGHAACSVDNKDAAPSKRDAFAFECVDVSSNLEQCGACALDGGVDCTALPGVAAVGCQAGVCEIWSCETGFEYNAVDAACVAVIA